MTTGAEMKKQNSLSQNYDGGAPLGGIAAMVVAMVPEKINKSLNQ